MRNSWKRQERKSECCAKHVDGTVKDRHPGETEEIKTKLKKNNKAERAAAEPHPRPHGFILYSLLTVHMLLPRRFKEGYTCQGVWEVKTEQMLRFVPWKGEIHLV